MRNITVSVDAEVYRRARIKAAELDTSVSRLVSNYLERLAGEENDFERLARVERELRATIDNFSAGDRLAREDVHARGS